MSAIHSCGYCCERVECMRAQRKELLAQRDGLQLELDRLTAEVAGLRAVVAAADVMRKAAVDVMQDHVEPEGISDSVAIERMYWIFDGPIQREYDAARAALAAQEPTAQEQK